MNQLLDPITSRDFSAGRVTKAAVSPALVPANSVANAINVDFSEIIGSGIVRKGKQRIVQLVGNGTTGQSNTTTVNSDELAVFGTTFQAQSFTPAAGQSQTLAFNLLLYRLGAGVGPLTFTIQGTTGGFLPDGVNQIVPISIDIDTLTTGTGGAIVTVVMQPGLQLNVGQEYYLVLEYAGGDGTHKIFWRRDAALVLPGDHSANSTNSGVAWNSQGGAFYFVQTVLDTSNLYNRMPLGLLGFIIGNLARGVVGYQDPLYSAGVIFYYDNPNSKWKISDQIRLSQTAKMRFAVLNGFVFMVNGSDDMRSSSDFGATWQNNDTIWLGGVPAAWSNLTTYATGDYVTYNGLLYQSLQDANTANIPVSSPSFWVQVFKIVPSLIITSANRLLVSGYAVYPSRVYFSSLVSPGSTPFLNWNTNVLTGDWIDINPDDGGVVTGFALNSSLTLVFKTNAMYRLNTITRSVDAENIFNIGAVSQECIVNCLGLTYFYSGQGIYQTDSTFPQQISRVGVQDFVDGIQDPTTVTAGTDGFNVYFSLGTVNVTFGPEDVRTYNKVVLKFSPRDQNWQIYVYDQRFGQMTLFGIYAPNVGVNMITAEWNGALATVNQGTGDDGAAVSYELETQEQEFGNRSHTKQISDKIIGYAKYGGEGMMSVKANDADFDSANIQMNQRVNVTTNVDFTGEFFIFRWQGEALLSRPIFEGYTLPKVTDLGVIQNGQQ